MRIKRLKRASKRLSYYKNCFNFRPPYQVVIDGTFSQSALKNKINLQEQMPKYLGEEVKMFSTACVITELDKLGSALYGASLIVKQYPVRHCGHEKRPISATKCLWSLVCKSNPHHLIIATQDKSLVNSLRQIPEVPVVTMKGNAITLLKPPKGEDVNHVSTSDALTPAESEFEQLKQLKAQVLGESEDEGKKKAKRKKAKAPNPLSCRPKKAKVSIQQQQKGGQSEEKGRKRRRIRTNLPRNVAKLLETAKNNKNG